MSASAWHRAVAGRAGWPWMSQQQCCWPPAPHVPEEVGGQEGLEDVTWLKQQYHGGQKRAAEWQPAGREDAPHLGRKLVPPGCGQPVHLHLESSWKGTSGQRLLAQEGLLESAKVVGGAAVLAGNVPVLAEADPFLLLLFILLLLTRLLQPAGAVPEARACARRTGAISGSSRAPGPTADPPRPRPAIPPNSPPPKASRAPEAAPIALLFTRRKGTCGGTGSWSGGTGPGEAALPPAGLPAPGPAAPRTCRRLRSASTAPGR